MKYTFVYAKMLIVGIYRLSLTLNQTVLFLYSSFFFVQWGTNFEDKLLHFEIIPSEKLD